MRPEQWQQIQSLFHRMIDSTDPAAELAREPDPFVAGEAQRLFDHHRLAGDSFLNQPPEAVRAFLSPVEAVLHPDSVLAGRFRVLRMAGEGGMGQVYEADDLLLNERVAIKAIRGVWADHPDLRQRFLSEVQNARRVTHPHVCRLHDCFSEGSQFFFSMEYIDGETLHDILRADHLSAADRLEIATQIGHGLAAVHGQNIVHGDLKTGNVMIARKAGALRAVLMDFGLADALGQSRAPFRAAGTPGYLAPELALGGKPSVASDLFAFGRVLEQLLPGDPFAARCCREKPQDRPASVSDWNRLAAPSHTRRAWIIALAGTGIAAGSVLLTHRGPELWTVRKTAILNLLGGDWGPLARAYVEHCLRQSPLLGVLPEELTRGLVREQGGDPDRPAPVGLLVAAARKQKASFVFDGDATGNSRQPRLRLTAYNAGDGHPQSKFELTAQSGESLASQISESIRRLRVELGEPPDSVASSAWNLHQSGSPSALALDDYFRGQQAYEAGETLKALDLYDDAVRVDPDFALAHYGRCRALSNLSREPEALAACARAAEKKRPLGHMDAFAIDGLNAVLCGRYEDAVAAYRRLSLLQPEQPGIVRQLGNVLGLAGRPAEAVDVTRRALALDPEAQMNWSGLALIQAESGDVPGASETVEQAKRMGRSHPSLLWSESLVHAMRGDFEGARALLLEMMRNARYERLARMQQVMLDVWSGNVRRAALQLESDLAADEEQQYEKWVLERSLRLSELEIEQGFPFRAPRWLDRIAAGTEIPWFATYYRHAAVAAVHCGHDELVARFVAKLDRIAAQWPSPRLRAGLCHVHGVRALAAGQKDSARDNLVRGYGLLPDAPMSLAAGRMFFALGEFSSAEEAWSSVETRLGTILQRENPTIVLESWLDLAHSFDHRNQPARAAEYRRKIVQQWNQWGSDQPIFKQAAAPFKV